MRSFVCAPLLLSFLLLPLTLCARAEAAPGCVATIEKAVHGSVQQQASGFGYRLAALRSDALRNRMWALVETCGRPELPLLAVAVPRGVGARVASQAVRLPVVHIGDEVTVLVRTGSSQMVLHGWAEQSGAVDSNVRVRLLRVSDDESAQPAKIDCRVTGTGTAEVVP